MGLSTTTAWFQWMVQMKQHQSMRSTCGVSDLGHIPWIALTPISSIAEEIHEEFPWFGALHRILSSRPNIVPPAIITGVGPSGREIVYNDPPPPSQERDPNVNPIFYDLSNDEATPPPSQRHALSSSQYPAGSQPLTPLFTQPGVPSLSSSQSPTPVLVSSLTRETTPFSPQSKFATMMAKAKENVKMRPHKRSLEDTLSEGIS